MYLVDTNVVSEARKGHRADAGVQAFFARAAEADAPLYLSVVTRNEEDFAGCGVHILNPFTG